MRCTHGQTNEQEKSDFQRKYSHRIDSRMYWFSEIQKQKWTRVWSAFIEIHLRSEYRHAFGECLNNNDTFPTNQKSKRPPWKKPESAKNRKALWCEREAKHKVQIIICKTQIKMHGATKLLRHSEHSCTKMLVQHVSRILKMLNCHIRNAIHHAVHK